ncbi:caspase family protein [Streptomyces goshikiensis]|uniref:caspase family protein n=1 Tax=Streptomyces goshikiensis TaxID=1942 RepID=UPI00369030A2
MSETETPEEIRGAALGVVVENYQSGRFRQLTGATAQMRELCELLEERGYGTTVVEDPEWNDVNKPLGDWARKWRATGGHGPAVVLWSGHGVLDDRELRLIVRDTVDPEFDGEVHSANLLASTASLSGADQVLLLIDTCHAGAGVVPSLKKALDRLSQRNLPPGRWAWFGVIASCRPQEKAEAGGVLLDAFARVLREGPRTDEYRHEWSRRNGQVSGNTVIQAVLAEWPSEVGHRPLNAMTGRDRLMFANPLRAAATEPELVEHLVQAARGAAPDDEGWFFSGRRRVLGEITEWLEARRPGLFLVTGSAGSGKSAVLGRIATLSDPAHRADVLAHQPLTPRDPDPGEDSVDVALHLRGFTVQQLAEAIARRLSLPRPQTPAALIAEVEKGWPESRRRLVLVLDGLDEAAPDQAHPVVEQLLAPLSRLSCVLLGSRDRPFRPQQEPGESLDRALSRILGIRARAADLDDESDTERDIQEYCRRRLLARALPMADATTAAELVARRASPNSGGFLFARMATDSVIRRLSAAGAEGWDWAEAIPSSISAAFTEDLESGPVRERDGAVLPRAAEDLLTALAWSGGNGMPARGVWEAAASALSGDGIEYGPEDVDWLLNEYGRYVVEDSDGTQAVYRLYHREFVAHLRHASGHSDGAYHVARAVVDLLRGQTSDATVSENANPYLRASLAAHAVMAGERGTSMVRELTYAQEEVFRPDLAEVLGDVAVSLSHAGRREEALAPAQEAADLYRALALNNPAAYLPELAGSLNNLANVQSATGDGQAALTTIAEAVTIRRNLAKANPAAHLPDLAGSLNNLAACQSTTGDRPGALTTITEAVTIRRNLAKTNPAAYLPNLATSLNNLATCQSDNGDRPGALTTITEATDLYRTLARINPAAHLPNLASSLNNLGTIQSETGDRPGALTTITEATDLYRTLARINPAAYLPNLASSLNNLANVQFETGDGRGALTTITKAVTIRRDLAKTNPAAHLANLASSLNNLANIQSLVGDRPGALTTITEATDLYRTLARTSPAVHLPSLATSLNNLATCQSDNGDRPGALTTITEATDLYRTLARTSPAAYLPDLAMSLNNLAAFQSGTGDGRGALSTITEATDLYRTLAQTSPAAYLPDLAGSLHNLSTCQSETGDRPGALTTITEAVTIRRDLAKTNPAAHLPNLVSSLNALAHMAPARQTLDAYSDTERSLSDHTQAAGYIAVQRATFQLTHVGTDVGIRALIPLARASQPQPSETADVVAFRARQVLRAHAAQEGPNQVVALWREETGIAPPAWLALPETALDLAVEWINCPTWTASRAFWDAHSHDLRSADTALALEEIALVTAAAAEHLQIVRTAAAEGPDDAFRPYLTGEVLHAWVGLPTWQESLTYLTDHEAVLLHDQALELLGAGLETADTALHFALIALARADGIPAAYGYADDRSTLHTRLQQLLASPEPQPDLLQALALLELFVYQEQFTAAAHLALAAALTGAPPAPDTVWPPAEPADRDRVISEVADLIGRQPQQAPALSALIRSILAASAAA